LPLRRINGIRVFQPDPAFARQTALAFRCRLTSRSVAPSNQSLSEDLGKTWVKNPLCSRPFHPFLSTKPSEIIGTSA
jgi:hypothetical protein